MYQVNKRLLGLIPACAGKTRMGFTRQRIRWAHPRVCGENRGNLDVLLSVDGSSPRVRGKRCDSLSHWGVFRLIPACAGKTREFIAKIG